VHIVWKRSFLVSFFCLLEMHALSFNMLTSLQNDHLNHHHLYKFLIIFYWWLCPYVAVSYRGNSMSFCLFFLLEYIPWCEKNSLLEIKKKEEIIIIYSLSYLLDGQQFFFLSFFIGHLRICCCFSHAYIYIFFNI
jgi:hypothetical protein